jgi:CRP/FNR family transcriptional regulator, anaerobic regulatory protein
MSVIPTFNNNVNCKTCSIKRLCLPVLLADSEMDHLDNIVQRKRVLNKNELLYSAGDNFEAVHAVRSGSLKSYTISQDGTEQLTGFHLPGEIVGLNAISNPTYPSFAKVLETSTVCTIPFDKLELLASNMPGLQKQLLRTMSQEIRDEQELMMLLSKKNADERFAAFIMNLSARYQRRGLSDKYFILSMTRGDIANYLGLAVETVSRLISRLQKKQYLIIQDRQVEILDIKAMSVLAGTACHI